MAETPKNREELLGKIADFLEKHPYIQNESLLFAEELLESIETLGVRLVPVTLPEEMMSCNDWDLEPADQWKALLAKSPFRPEQEGETP